MKKMLLIKITILICYNSIAQVFVNSYDTVKVLPTGMFSSQKSAAEIMIAAPDTTGQINSSNGIYKFAVPQTVNLFPLFQGSKDTVSSTFIFKQKITANNANSITITFDTLQLSKNAQLYIYDAIGKTVTGPILATENTRINSTWSSNVFSGNSVILELKVPQLEITQNKLHISKILYGLSTIKNSNKDSADIGNFNASSSCNINVICPVGNWTTERKAIC